MNTGDWIFHDPNMLDNDGKLNLKCLDEDPTITIFKEETGMNTGNWKIDVNVNGMPQKVATAFEKLKDTLVGVDYEFIAYLGSQEVNGVNHAVLAKQIVTTGRDSNNIVVIIFNEKPGEMETPLVAIERVLESGAALGGTTIRVDKILDLEGPEMSIWNGVFAGYVGISMRPIAYLGSQMTKGVDCIYAATAEPMNLEGQKQAVIVRINPLERTVRVVNFLVDRGTAALNYAFNW